MAQKKAPKKAAAKRKGAPTKSKRKVRAERTERLKKVVKRVRRVFDNWLPNEATEFHTTGKVDIGIARRVWRLVNAGLSSGIGMRRLGKMCIEAAVYCATDGAEGYPKAARTVTDKPSCVQPRVRQTKIGLNDCAWSSNKARGKAMADIAIAQLGSEGVVNGDEFSDVLTRLVMRKVIPFVLRNIRILPDSNLKNTKAGPGKALLVLANKLEKGQLDGLELHKLGGGHLNACYNYSWFEWTRKHGSVGWRRSSDSIAFLCLKAVSRHWEVSSGVYEYRNALIGANDTLALLSYTQGTTNKKLSDEVLTIYAQCILAALKKCKSPGVQLLAQLKRELRNQQTNTQTST